MLASDDINFNISLFLKGTHKKVLLLYGQSIFSSVELVLAYVKISGLPCYYFDLSQASIEENTFINIPSEQSSIFVLYVNVLENPFIRYQLDRYQSKVIILCDISLLHPTLDPALYFAPLKGGTVQRRLFTKMELRRVPASTIKQDIESKLESPVTPEKKLEQSSNLHNNFLNKKLKTHDSNLMQMLADRVLTDESYKDFLFGIIYKSRHDERIKFAAANAITILNYAKVSFSGMDFSHTQLQGADMTGAICDHTDFFGANLKDVKFVRAWLRFSCLQNSCLEDAQFDELPYMSCKGYVASIAYSPNGESIAIASGNNLEIRTIATDQSRNIYNGRENIKCVAFSKNSQYLAYGGKYVYLLNLLKNNTIKLNTSTHEYSALLLLPPNIQISLINIPSHVIALQKQGDNVSAYFFQDNIFKQVHLGSITANDLGNLPYPHPGEEPVTIKIDNTNQDVVDKIIISSCSQVTTVVFSNDAKYLAACCEDSIIRVWHIETTLLYRFSGHNDVVKSIAFSTNNYELASGSSDGTIRMWNLNSKDSYVFFEQGSGWVYGIDAVTFSQDGNYFAAGFNASKEIQVWVLATNMKRSVKGTSSQINSLIFSPNSEYLACGGLESTVQIYNMESEDSVAIEGHEGLVWSLCFSPDSQYLASGSDDKTVRIRYFIPSFNRFKSSFIGHTQWVTGIAYSPDEKMILSTGFDGTILAWNIYTDRPYYFVKHNCGINCLSFNLAGMYLAYGDQRCVIKLKKLNNGSEHNLLGHTHEIKGIAFSRNGQFLLSGGDTLRVWDLAVGEPFLFREVKGGVGVTAVAFSHKGQYIAAGGNYFHPQIRIWEMDTLDEIHTLEGHKHEIYSIVFSSDDKYLVSASNDKTIRLWDLLSRKSRIFEGHTLGVACLAFNSDNQYLASGSHDATVRIWHVSSGACVAQLTGYSGTVSSIAWNEKDFLITGSWDKSVKIWKRNGNGYTKEFWQLLKSSSQCLSAEEAQFYADENISPINRQLLVQRGAKTFDKKINRYHYFQSVLNATNNPHVLSGKGNESIQNSM